MKNEFCPKCGCNKIGKKGSFNVCLNIDCGHNWDILNKPEPLTVINLDNLILICQEYIDTLTKNGYVKDDFDHYIFECAMETVYGKDIWKYVRDIYK